MVDRLALLCCLTALVWAAIASRVLGQETSDPGAPSVPASGGVEHEEPTLDGRESQSQAYQTALREALAAQDAGDLAAARDSMRRAHEIEPSARTLRGLGVLALADDHPIEAARWLRASLDDPRQALPPVLRASVQEQLQECFERMSRVRPSLTPPNARLSVDDQPARLEPSGELWLLPGRHEVSLEAVGHEPQRFSQVFEPGVIHVLRVSLVPAAQVPKSPPERHAPEGPSSLSRSHLRLRRVRNTAFASGATMIATGLGAWLTARVRYGQMVRTCDGTCSPEHAASLWKQDHIDALTIAASVLSASGAALLISGTALRLWEHRNYRDGSNLSLGLQGTAVSFRWRY